MRGKQLDPQVKALVTDFQSETCQFRAVVKWRKTLKGGEVHKKMDTTLKNTEKAGKTLTNKDTPPANLWK